MTAQRTDDKTVIARWESRSGKHWVEVHADGSYTAPDCGGCREDAQAAVAHVQSLVDGGGYFQPDSAKTPMRRVSD